MATLESHNLSLRVRFSGRPFDIFLRDLPTFAFSCFSRVRSSRIDISSEGIVIWETHRCVCVPVSRNIDLGCKEYMIVMKPCPRDRDGRLIHRAQKSKSTDLPSILTMCWLEIEGSLTDRRTWTTPNKRSETSRIEWRSGSDSRSQRTRKHRT